MEKADWAVLVDEDGRTYVVQVKDGSQKVKGLGVFDAMQALNGAAVGDRITIGQKELIVAPTRLPELTNGMLRRAQTIGSKDAGVLIARLGLGPGDTVLEAGIGSGGLSLHIARVLGNTGSHFTVEPRSEHADVALENLARAADSWPEFPHHTHFEGTIEDQASAVALQADEVDAVLLDLPEHPSAIAVTAPLLAAGGRLACYCPVTQQLERAWEACEEAGLTVEWAGELMEREWGRASKGGIRPVNGPFGHTAFLLIARR